MVGGWIIEKRPMTLEGGKQVIRYWVVDRNRDELAVFAEPAEAEPDLGEEIWWQSGRIYFDNDKRTLTKIANSHRPEASNHV